MTINNLQKAIAGEKLDGWLFFNYLHRDSLADRILEIKADMINSRPWFYLVPVSDTPLRICNAVEPESLKKLPGELKIYSSRNELIEILRNFIKEKGPDWGAQFSKEITSVSTLDHGTALTLEEVGIRLCSSSGLIQRLNGLLDGAGMESHNKAADELYEIVDLIWNRISEYFKGPRDADGSAALTEQDVQKWILDEFKNRGMITDHLPIVACGSNSGNPHYATEDHNTTLSPDSVLQLDIWAKFNTPESIYADISWIGWTGPSPSGDTKKMFSAVCDARDKCVQFIDKQLSAGHQVTGSDADNETRKVLIDHGYEKLIKHRTGHGIDTEVHGSGACLDSVEFPDKRLLLEGSCFSIEPGLYSPEFGMRTEINAYIKNGKINISGPGPQKTILAIQ